MCVGWQKSLYRILCSRSSGWQGGGFCIMKQHWATALVTERFSLSHFSASHAFSSQKPENTSPASCPQPWDTSILPICSHSLSFSICTYIPHLLDGTNFVAAKKFVMWCKTVIHHAEFARMRHSFTMQEVCIRNLRCSFVLRSRPIQLFAIYGSSRVAAFLGNPIFTFMHCSTRSLRFNPLDPRSWRKNPKSVPLPLLVPRNFLQKMDLSGETGGTWFTPASSTGWMWLAPKMRFSLIALLFHCETWTIDVTYICILHTYTCLEYLMMNKGSRISKLDSQLNPGS